MNMTKEKAQRLIGGILSELEKDNDTIVKRIDLVDLDTTTHGDTRPRLVRWVEIDLERLPGTSWAK